MNCRDIDELLLVVSRLEKFPPDAQTHIGTCERCRQLTEILTGPDVAADLSSETLGKVEKLIMADLRPVRPIASTTSFSAAFLGIFILMIAYGVYGQPLAGYSGMSTLQRGMIFSFLVINATLVANALARQMVPGQPLLAAPRMLMSLALVSTGAAVAIVLPFQRQEHFWLNAWMCLKPGILIGLVSGAPLWLVLRRGTTLYPEVTAGLAGLLAGMVATTALEFRCPNLEAWHALGAHLGVAVVCAAIGSAAGWAFDELLVSKSRWAAVVKRQ